MHQIHLTENEEQLYHTVTAHISLNTKFLLIKKKYQHTVQSAFPLFCSCETSSN